jgi:flagellar biosynthesis protein FliQ
MPPLTKHNQNQKFHSHCYDVAHSFLSFVLDIALAFILTVGLVIFYIVNYLSYVVKYFSFLPKFIRVIISSHYIHHFLPQGIVSFHEKIPLILKWMK